MRRSRSRSRRTHRLALGVAIALLPAATAPATGDAVLLDAFREPRLELSQARSVGRLRLDLGLAALRIERGLIFPAEAVAGETREFVFLGSARLELEPPDAIERQQLELFTGLEALDEAVSAAVLVLAPDGAGQALMGLPRAEALEPGHSSEATTLFETWVESGERSVLGVEYGLFGDALGDPFYRGYFAGLFDGEELGRFVYLHDPRGYEQVTLGQFVPFEVTDRQVRKLERALEKQQSKGRLLGVGAELLGQFDNWLSASRQGSDGGPVRGGSCFRATHYDIELTVEPKSLDVEARVTVDLVARIGGCRLTRLALYAGLQVHAVRDGAGRELTFDRRGAEILLVHPQPSVADETRQVVVEYGGPLIGRVGQARLVEDTQDWYPNAGHFDWATYEALFRWPRKLELVASGVEIERGRSGDFQWQRRRLERPAILFTFELGRFDLHRRETNDGLTLTAAIDPYSDSFVGDPEEVLETAEQAVRYLSERFGSYTLPELTLVTVPRGFSQATPGLITLSTRMLSDSPWARLFQDGSPESIIAHEIAHQWWAHVVGFESYRDVWISEALASYSALLFARDELREFRYGPTRRWQRQLLRTTPDGRRIESVGPIILGTRLQSSRSVEAFSAIVYKKGAVVLDMLAQSFGEEAFGEVLRAILEAFPGRSLSTEQFITALESATGADLGPFAQQFIYGTGLPEVYYDYQTAPDPAGGWRISGSARQVSPTRYEYAVVERKGRLDVERRAIPQMEMADSQIYVPLQVAVHDPSHQNNEASDADTRGNRVMEYPLLLRGEETPFELRVEHEPKQVWLDATERVFGRFFSAHASPKRITFFEGIDLAAASRLDEAEERYRAALEAPAHVGPGLFGELDQDTIRGRGHRLDARIHLALARLYLDQGRTESADRQIELSERARDLAKKADGLRGFTSSTVLEARLALQKGNPQHAYELLARPILKRRSIGSREGALVLAIAARTVGRTKEFESALELAERGGADVSLLERP